jgi:hypothetical protein
MLAEGEIGHLQTIIQRGKRKHPTGGGLVEKRHPSKVESLAHTQPPGPVRQTMSPFFQSGDIFLGNTPSNERAWLAPVLNVAHSHYKRLAIPCVGKFGGAEAAINSYTWKPGQIDASDISLFTSVLGYYLAERDVAELQVVVDEGEILTHPDEILYELKLAAFRNLVGKSDQSGNYYNQIYLRDLERRRDDHIAKLGEDLKGMADKLMGVKYETRDLFEHFEAVAGDKETVIWLNPPIQAGDYEKMYSTGGRVRWAEPEVNWFDPKTDVDRLLDIMESADALTFIGVKAPLIDRMQPFAVFAEERKNPADTRVVLCNRPSEITDVFGLTVLPRKYAQDDVEPYPAPVLPVGYEITDNSEIVFISVSGNHGMYYRDLFSHRFGTSGAESIYLMMADGYIAGVYGIGTTGFYHGHEVNEHRVLEEQFGFTAPSDRHPRLTRLGLMLITTQIFLDNVIGPDQLYRPEGIATTCITKYPEHKGSRGIHKLYHRERNENGPIPGDWFRLRYWGVATDLTYQEVLAKWLKAERQREKQLKSSPASDKTSKSGESKSTTSKSKTKTRAHKVQTSSIG